MKDRIVIGSRGSRLAVIQAESVAEQLREASPDVEVEILRIVTEGDRRPELKLGETGDVGIFVKALEEALIRGSIDMAVHSLKDLPATIPAELCLQATTRRVDPRDAVVANCRLLDLKPGSIIGTSSVRRCAQLKSLRRDLETLSIRGNVETRLRQVFSGAMDGVIVAVAAMLRLGLADKITEYLPIEQFLPAAGQGALAIEARCDDQRVAGLCASINHQATWKAITAEREFLNALGGGCSAPISCLATVQGSRLRVMGMVSDSQGVRVLKDSLEDDTDDPAAAGVRLAKAMLNSGAADILKR